MPLNDDADWNQMDGVARGPRAMRDTTPIVNPYRGSKSCAESSVGISMPYTGHPHTFLTSSWVAAKFLTVRVIPFL